MWFKCYYPHEFYAACLEIMKEDRLLNLATDAAKRGIEILPPDVNESTHEFRRLGDHLLCPLNRIKGLSEATERAVLEARAKVGGKFTDAAHLEASVEKRRCNKRHRELLERVGALASITPGALPARHSDRVKDQLDLLPGLVIEHVRASRAIVMDPYIREELAKLLHMEHAKLGACPMPRLGKKPKFMVLLDCPTKHDERAGKILEGDSGKAVKEALKLAGLSMNDGYFTTFVKVPKKGAQLSNDEILASRPFLDREIELLKPPVIVCLGGTSARTFCPDEKGGIMELAGKVRYDKALDASIVIGISPGMLYHDPSKQTVLNDVFAKVAEILS